MPTHAATRGGEQNSPSDNEMREVTIPVTAFEKSHGKMFVTLTYPRGLNDSEVMENVLGFAVQELHEKPDIIEKFVESRTKYHREYAENLKQLELNRQNIQMQLTLEEERTKRLGIVLACCLIALAFVLIVFYPDGREQFVYPIAIALFVCAAGAFGYKRLWGKAAGVGEIGVTK